MIFFGNRHLHNSPVGRMTGTNAFGHQARVLVQSLIQALSKSHLDINEYVENVALDRIVTGMVACPLELRSGRKQCGAL